MTWVPVALAALLLLAVAYPLIEPFLSRERRARRAHRGRVVHWYPNYDEDLRFEPRHEADIVAVRRSGLLHLGYAPGSRTVVVPRTFRRRVAGDANLQLWRSHDETLRPVWICDWHGREIHAASLPALDVLPLTHALLLRIDSGPAPAFDDERAANPDDSVQPTGEIAKSVASPPEHAETGALLLHEASRFSCHETTNPGQDQDQSEGPRTSAGQSGS